MRFKLTKASDWNSTEDKIKYEKLGFKFEPEKDSYFKHTPWYTVENSEIEFNTLEELLNFIKKYGEIILYEDEITIYDDYIE